MFKVRPLARWMVFSLTITMAPMSISYAQPDGSSIRKQSKELHKGRLFAYASLGAGGDSSFDISTPTYFQRFDGEMTATPGFGLGMEYVLHRFFALGGRFGLDFCREKGAKNRDKMLDLDALPKIRLPLEKSEFYLAVPLGLSLNWDPDDETGAAVGFNVGVLPGFQHWLTPQFGIFSEFGWAWHLVQESLIGPGYDIDIQVSYSQFVLHLGLAYGI